MSVYKSLEQTHEVKTDGSYLYYAATNDDGKDFGAVLRVIASDGRITAQNGTIQFAEANKVLALAKVFTHGDREQEWLRLQNELSSMDQTYEQLLASHIIEHQRLFFSAKLNLYGEQDHLSNEELLLLAYDGEAPTSLIEKMWAYGRYLFISGTASDGMPFEMYGLWAGDYKLTWCLNMANENVQMMYWHTMAGGLSEMMRRWSITMKV